METNFSEPPAERKALNQTIEDIFIEASGDAGSIRTHFMTGNGVLLRLYESFFFHLAVLFDLTQNLPGIEENNAACVNLEKWLNLGPIKSGEKDIRGRCQEGLKIFTDYKKLLTKKGVIKV